MSTDDKWNTDRVNKEQKGEEDEISVSVGNIVSI